MLDLWTYNLTHPVNAGEAVRMMGSKLCWSVKNKVKHISNIVVKLVFWFQVMHFAKLVNYCTCKPV
jgi:hypothetical protein